MRILFHDYPLAGGINADQEPFQVTLETSADVQIATALRGETAMPMNRGNRTTILQFSVRRKHASVDHATEFLLTHALHLKEIQGEVTIISEGATQRSFALGNGAIRHIHGSQEGMNTLHYYEIIGGNLYPIIDGEI
jgi:hypothetical protein